MRRSLPLLSVLLLLGPATASGQSAVHVTNSFDAVVEHRYETAVSPLAAGSTASLLVPIVLSSAGANDSFYTSELTLTNRGATPAVLNLTYTAAFGGGGGSGSDTLAPGQQKVVADAIAYLISLGIPMPGSGNRGGTLRIDFTGLGAPGAASVTARTTTAVSSGRAGLAYSGIAAGLTEPAYLCGLRQNANDRSNVAILNAGATGAGNVVLRVTIHSGNPANPAVTTLPDETLSPGGFKQFNEILASAGLAGGFVKVERISGTAPFYCYGVVNDQANSDGSFVPPLVATSLAGRSGLTLPVVVESPAFQTEVVLSNLSTSARTLLLSYVSEGVTTPDLSTVASVTLAPGEQLIIPSFVQYLRDRGISGPPAPGPTLVGALFVTAPSADVAGIFLGGRTSTPGGGGRFGLFYTATPSGSCSTGPVWLFGLQQNAENRANLALVNTGEADATTDSFHVELFEGETGLVNGAFDVSLPARRWTQIGTVLSQHAPGTTQGYARVTRTAGTNPFLAYAVINDGGSPGDRSGDGAFLPAVNECSYSLSPSTFTLPAAGSAGSVEVTTASGCPWAATAQTSWIQITSATSGTGSGTVTFSVSTNTDPAPRTGTLSIGGQTVSVTQAAAAQGGSYDGNWTGSTSHGKAVSFRISKTAFEMFEIGFVLSGGCGVEGKTTVTFTVPKAITGSAFTIATTPGGNPSLSFTAHGTFTSDSTASGDATFSFVQSLPLTPCTATGTSTWTASKGGAPACDYSVTPATQSFQAIGGAGSVAVATTAGCAWSATSGSSWVTITSGSSGAGNGTVSYQVAANTGSSSRTGSLTVAARTVTISQAGTSSGANYDGTWSGTTSQGKAISFTILNNAITRISIGYLASGGGCNTEGSTTITYTTPKPISGDSFTITSTGSGNPALGFTVSGTFSSASTASGNASFTFQQSFPLPTCSGTGSGSWTATRS